MDALKRRREEDLRKIKDLDMRFPGLVELMLVDKTNSRISLRIKIPTAGDSNYPRQVQKSTVVEIELPARYPFEAPRARVLGTLWNPNVFANGNFCLGAKWIPTEGLDMFVERIMKIIAFDPLIINTDSPANRDASQWYELARMKHPGAFPSIRLEPIKKPEEKPGIIWKSAGMKGNLKDL